MTTFSFQNKIISIVYYFSSDSKMMSIVLGLYRYKVEPILPEIPFKNFIIDSIHLFLRKSDTLFELLIHDLCRIDKFSDCSIFNENKHCELNKMPAGIQKMINYNQKNLSHENGKAA
ncbi:hypothetical protein BpHYR1_021115 [Brachionus plicatilis]|uniref:Uncharacterized protein n=1 Tax=Brachionus plicatilis TaxID=10195 RepID=A0A3M7SDM8_BRAPC|nr:hypothetical protein BpHYR1_021115 [Brachionus plicatilis]